MSNSFLNSTLISKEAVAIFKSFNSFIAAGYKGDYSQMFNGKDYKPGDTVNVRLDNYFIGQRGDSVTAESIVEDSFPLTIQPLYSVPISYRPTDLQRNIADFGEEILKPAVRRLVAMMNSDIATGVLTQVNPYVGDPTANLSSFASISQVNPVLDNLNANGYDRYLAISPDNAQSVQNSLQNSFVSPLNKDITYNASMGRLADMDIMKDNAIQQQVVGTHANSGSITVQAAIQTGNTISLSGVTNGATFNAGDIFTIAGVQSWDRINQKPVTNPALKAFTVLTTVTASGTTVTLTIAETLVNTGPRQNFYVAGASPNQIPANAVVTFVNNNFSANVAFTERGLITVIPPLQKMDSPFSDVFTDANFGVSLRVSKTADVLNNMNIMRLDGQMAFKWVPGQAVKLLSK